MVQATWLGAKVAQEQEVAWVTALALTTNADQEPQVPLPTISKEELTNAQKEDQSIGDLIKLKETNTMMTSDTKHTVSRTDTLANCIMTRVVSLRTSFLGPFGRNLELDIHERPHTNPKKILLRSSTGPYCRC